ncbi:DMT family transporter, partial [Alicyclobacillaceae bacterium I2511]
MVLATLLWSGNYIAGRVLAGAMSSITLNAVRWSISAVILLLVMRFSKQPLPLLREWRPLALMGFLGMFVFSTLTYLGLRSVSAAQAGMLSGLIPVFILVTGIFLLHQRPTGRSWMGVGISVLGVGLLMWLGEGGHFQLSWGILELLLAALAWALYTVIGKLLEGRMLPLTLTAGSAVYGALFSDLVAGVRYRPGSVHLSWLVLACVFYVSTLASVVAYWLWTVGVKRAGAAAAAPYMNLLPVWTVFLGVALLHERVSAWEGVG